MKQKFAGLLVFMLVFSFGLTGCDWLFNGNGGKDDQPKSLTITEFGSNHENYYYQIDLFENETDIKEWFNYDNESLSKLCLQGQISGGLISKLLLDWDNEEGDFAPFTGTGPYYIFLQIFDMDLEESNYRFDQSYYLSAAIDFNGQQDIELKISDFDGFNPFNGNGGGDEPAGHFQISGTIIGDTKGYTEFDITVFYGSADQSIGYTWITDITEDNTWYVSNTMDPIYAIPGTNIYVIVEIWKEGEGFKEFGSYIIRTCDGQYKFDVVIDLDTPAAG
ncbi:MAG: hypothetical protein FWD13_03380 [Treponema sp.]|nr:hypothetical protein [Treponema sp.]